MQKVSQNDALAASAIQDALGVTVAPPFVGLVVVDEGRFCGAFLFNNFDRVNVDMSVVLVSALNIACARDLARYTFGKLGVRRVTCVTAVENYLAIKSLRKLRFELEGVLRDRLPSGDAYIFSLLASDQKVVKLGDRYGEHPIPA